MFRLPRGFLNALRELTTKHGALLIFDEVMTGFRLARGGAQELYRITPDITCLGKIIGGGLPVGAYGGSRELMRNIAPVGSIYQAGTLSGNPLAMTAGLLTLRRLKDKKIYEQLEQQSAKLCAGLSQAAAEAGIKTVTNRVGSMWTGFLPTSRSQTGKLRTRAIEISTADFFTPCWLRSLSGAFTI